MTAPLIGYSRCSTDQQGLTAQRDGLAALARPGAAVSGPSYRCRGTWKGRTVRAGEVWPASRRLPAVPLGPVKGWQ